MFVVCCVVVLLIRCCGIARYGGYCEVVWNGWCLF